MPRFRFLPKTTTPIEAASPPKKKTLFQHSDLGSASESRFTPSLPAGINVTGAPPPWGERVDRHSPCKTAPPHFGQFPREQNVSNPALARGAISARAQPRQVPIRDAIRRLKRVPISESSCGAVRGCRPGRVFRRFTPGGQERRKGGSDLFLVSLFLLSTCRIYEVSDERIHGSAIQAELLEDTLSQIICVKHRP